MTDKPTFKTTVTTASLTYAFCPNCGGKLRYDIGREQAKIGHHHVCAQCQQQCTLGAVYPAARTLCMPETLPEAHRQLYVLQDAMAHLLTDALKAFILAQIGPGMQEANTIYMPPWLEQAWTLHQALGGYPIDLRKEPRIYGCRVVLDAAVFKVTHETEVPDERYA